MPDYIGTCERCGRGGRLEAHLPITADPYGDDVFEYRWCHTCHEDWHARDHEHHLAAWRLAAKVSGRQHRKEPPPVGGRNHPDPSGQQGGQRPDAVGPADRPPTGRGRGTAR